MCVCVAGRGSSSAVCLPACKRIDIAVYSGSDDGWLMKTPEDNCSNSATHYNTQVGTELLLRVATVSSNIVL